MGGVVPSQEISIKHQKTTSGKGSQGSQNFGSHKETSIESLIEFLLPIYYVKRSMTLKEMGLVQSTWKMVVNNQAEEFYRLKREDPTNTPCATPMDYFANRFYRRLIEIHPTCYALFTKSTLKQGTLLRNMITMIVTGLEKDDEEPEKLKKIFTRLAEGHNRLGVRSVEYSIFGEVLFWTLRLTLGANIYNVDVHTAWVILYSQILSIIIPITVKYERDNRDSLSLLHEKRLKPILNLSDNNILPGDALVTSASSSSMH